MADLNANEISGRFSLLRLWRDERGRGILLQVLVLVSVLGFIAYIASNTIDNMHNYYLFCARVMYAEILRKRE